jgi:hypothetical protein
MAACVAACHLWTVRHVMRVGDHLQAPFCSSEAAAAAGLAVSKFERLMAAGVPSAMQQVGVLGLCNCSKACHVQCTV